MEKVREFEKPEKMEKGCTWCRQVIDGTCVGALKGGKYLCNECLVPLVSFGNQVSVTRLGDLLDFGQLF